MSPSSTTSSDPSLTGIAPDGLVVVASPPSDARHRALAWTVVLLFVGVTAGTALLDAVKPKPPAAAAARLAKVDGATFTDGSFMREVETWLRLRSRVRQAVLPHYAILLWRALDQVPQELVAGPDGWLFVRYRVPGPRLDRRVATLGANLISAIRLRLAANDVDLFLVTIPDKSMVYEELLPPGYAARPDLYEALIAALRARGVNTVDLLTPLRAERATKVYAKTDSHWTERGMLVAAREVSAALGLGAPESRRVTRIVSRGLTPEPGDMFPMLGVRPERLDDVLHLREPAETFTVVDATDPATTRNRADGITDVILVGSSYSADTNFRDFLEHFLARDVWRSAAGGVGTEQPLLRALAAASATRKPKIVIWEYPAAFFFWPEGPLPAFGDLILAIEAPAVEIAPNVAITPPAGPTPSIVGANASLQIRARAGAGDGSVSVRLTGDVQGGDASVSVRGSGWAYAARWAPGAGALVLPLVSDEANDAYEITVRAPDGVRVAIERIEAVGLVLPATRR